MNARAILALTSFLILFGIFQANFTISEYPRTPKPVLTVVASLPGASSHLVQEKITKVIEKSLRGQPGLQQIRSYSRAGRCSVVLEYKTDIDLNSSYLETSSRLARLRLSEPVQIFRGDIDGPAFIHIVATEKTAEDLEELVTQIEQLSGVAQVSVSGGSRLEQVVTRIDDRLKMLDIVHHFNDKLKPIADTSVGPLILDSEFNISGIPAEEGVDIKLQEYTKIPTYHNGKPSVLLSIRALPDADILSIRKEISQIESKDDNVHIFIDNTSGVQDALKHFYIALMVAIIIIGIVVSYFINYSAVAIIIAALLVNILLLSYLSVINISMNIITLMALVVAVGFMIDDAIVMVEGIAQGKQPKDIFRPIITISSVLIAVFLPALFIGGQFKMILSSFAAVMIASVIISALVACLVIPALANIYSFSPKHTKLFLPRMPVKYLLTGIVATGLISIFLMQVNLMPVIPRDYLIVRHSDNSIDSILNRHSHVTQKFDGYKISMLKSAKRISLRDEILDTNKDVQVFMPNSALGQISNEKMKVAIFSEPGDILNQLKQLSYVKQVNHLEPAMQPTWVYTGHVSDEERLVLLAINDGILIDGLPDIRILLPKDDKHNVHEFYFGQPNSLSEQLLKYESSKMFRRIDGKNAEIISIDTNAINKTKKFLEDQGVEFSLIGYSEHNLIYKQLLPLLFFGLLAAYVVLVMLFNSFLIPIYAIVPGFFAMLGAFIAAVFTDFNLASFIGMLCGIGLVVKHSILIYSESGTIFERISKRLRPIYLTSLATILGAIPLLLMFGPVAPITRSLALSLIFSMIIGTFAALYVLPILTKCDN